MAKLNYDKAWLHMLIASEIDEKTERHNHWDITTRVTKEILRRAGLVKRDGRTPLRDPSDARAFPAVWAMLYNGIYDDVYRQVMDHVGTITMRDPETGAKLWNLPAGAAAQEHKVVFRNHEIDDLADFALGTKPDDAEKDDAQGDGAEAPEHPPVPSSGSTGSEEILTSEIRSFITMSRVQLREHYIKRVRLVRTYQRQVHLLSRLQSLINFAVGFQPKVANAREAWEVVKQSGMNPKDCGFGDLISIFEAA